MALCVYIINKIQIEQTGIQIVDKKKLNRNNPNRFITVFRKKKAIQVRLYHYQ